MWPDEIVSALTRTYLSLARHARQAHLEAGDNPELQYEAAVRRHDADTVWLLRRHFDFNHKSQT